MLHGTYPLSDDTVRVGTQKGMRKINQNGNVRDGYHKYMEENFSKVELTTLQTQGVKVYSKDIGRFVVEVLGSAGKA